jgi:hypothetical protein
MLEGGGVYILSAPLNAFDQEYDVEEVKEGTRKCFVCSIFYRLVTIFIWFLLHR